MGQHASATFDSIKKQDLLDANIQTRSVIRRKCYKMKHAMIVSSMRNLLACTVAGFFFNLPLMGAIVIVYEKVSVNLVFFSCSSAHTMIKMIGHCFYSCRWSTTSFILPHVALSLQYAHDIYEYSNCMLPIIVQLSLVLLVILMTLFSLGVDLLDKGCLAWHRDSVGYLLQTIIANVCMLVTAVNLMRYMEQYEENDDIAIKHSVMQCFVPLLVLAGLWLVKICCFKVKNSIMHLAISVSMASMAFAFERDRKSTRLNSSHLKLSRMPSSA